MSAIRIAKSGAKSATVLPVDAITRTFGIFGQRGTGKTNSAVVLAEGMIRAGGHVVILDPVGAWWGITHDGEGRGMAGIVIGGEHADVPLEETAGHLVAELIVGRHWPVVVVDMRLLRKGAQRRFLADFLEELYHRNREALHVFFEEADTALPQQPRGMDPTLGRVLGAAEDIVKYGRSRGLGATLVSQRFATVNANVREQVETLILMRLMGPLDRKAAKSWIETNGDAGVTAKVLDSMAQLALGEGWLYSPGWLRVLERVRMKYRQTFDSSATPEVGQKAPAPGKRAPVDLDVLRTQMAETVERAAANDPKALRKRVAELEKQLAAAPVEQKHVEPEVVYVPSKEGMEFLARVDEQVRKAGISASDYAEQIVQLAEEVEALRKAWESRDPQKPRPPVMERPAPVAQVMGRPVTQRSREVGGDVTGPEQKVLDALAWWSAIGVYEPERGRVAFVAGYHERTKGFLNALGSLNSAGRITYGVGTVRLTDEGAALAQAPAATPSRAELHELVYAQVGPQRARTLEPLVAAYPDSMTRVELAEHLGYHERTKGFLNAIGKLRGLGLIDYPAPGNVAATDLLFP